MQALNIPRASDWRGLSRRTPEPLRSSTELQSSLNRLKLYVWIGGEIRLEPVGECAARRTTRQSGGLPLILG